MSRHLFAAALVASALVSHPAASQAQKQAPVLTEGQVEAVVRKWIDEHPDLVIESLNRFVAKDNAKKSEASNNQALSVMGEIFDVSGMPMIGSPSAKVTLTYFLDGACGYCKAMTQAMDDLVSKNPDVRIAHRWVGFLGPASEYTLRAATVVWKRHPDRYRDFYHDIMTQKGPLSNEVVDKALARALTEDVALQVRSEIVSGADRKAVDETVAANMGLSQRAGVAGTPTVFVSGIGKDGIMRGLQKPESLKEAVEKSRLASVKP